jgi:signal peptidase II
MTKWFSGLPWKYKALGLITSVVLLLDQWTKHLIHHHFRWGEMVPIVPAFFHLTYFRNHGAAFSLLDDAPARFRDPFFLLVPILASSVIVVIFRKLSSAQRVVPVCLSLILGGTIGNLIDRLHLGYVVDFLYFHWKTVYYWPAFNVADSCIVVGVITFLGHSFLNRGSSRPVNVPPPAEPPPSAAQ